MVVDDGCPGSGYNVVTTPETGDPKLLIYKNDINQLENQNNNDDDKINLSNFFTS